MAWRRSGVRSPSAPLSDSPHHLRARRGRRRHRLWRRRRRRRTASPSTSSSRAPTARSRPSPKTVRAWCGPFDDESRGHRGRPRPGRRVRRVGEFAGRVLDGERGSRRRRARPGDDAPEQLRLHGAAGSRPLRLRRRGRGRTSSRRRPRSPEGRSASSWTAATRATPCAWTSTMSCSAASTPTSRQSRSRAPSSLRSRGNVEACVARADRRGARGRARRSSAAPPSSSASGFAQASRSAGRSRSPSRAAGRPPHARAAPGGARRAVGRRRRLPGGRAHRSARAIPTATSR